MALDEWINEKKITGYELSLVLYVKNLVHIVSENFFYLAYI